MKKISLLLLFLIILTSCSTVPAQPQKSVKEPSYEIILVQDYKEFENASVDYEIISRSEKLSTPKEEKIQLGKQSITADLVEQWFDSMGNVKYKCYSSKDKETTYITTNYGKRYVMLCEGDNVLLKNNSGEISEKTFLAMADECISKFVSSKDYKNYQYTLKTVVFSDGYSPRRREEDGFYLCDDEEEYVREYSMRYTRFNDDGIKTDEYIEIRYDAQGNIFGFTNCQPDADWNSVKYDMEKVNESVDTFLKKYLSDDILLEEYTIGDTCLCYVQKEIVLKVKIDALIQREELDLHDTTFYLYVF